MGEAIVFTSGKGGVGKTTTIANIGAGLSQLDKKVVMLDTDMGLRNLDVVMGLEDRITYNLLDLLENRCRLNQALIRDKRYPNLYMIPASLKNKRVKEYEDKLNILITQLKKEFDFCLIDCPAGIDDGFHFAISSADRAIVVTTPHISSVRDAGRVIYLLECNHIGRIELLINEVDEKLIRKNSMLSVSDVEEILNLKSIGHIPVDSKIIMSQNKGIPVISYHTKAKRCFLDLCRKISSAEVFTMDLSQVHSLSERKECNYVS